ncbi:hypothetical protein B0H14DRAFT_2535919 [Mycena olivaceomarginata]|nr:hypothetical protein B0H14DRAFT_2535919 [Mycena olivaceomarginata]
MLNKDRVCAFVLLIIAHHELDVLALPTKNRPALLYIACVYLLLLGSSHPFSDGPSRILSSGVHYRYARNDSSISPLNNSVAGAVQIGVILSYALFGVTTTQAYTYYCRFPGDPRMLKALVAFVWICEISSTVCVGHLNYTFSILDFGHPELILGTPPKSLSTSVIFSGFTTACVHSFFAFRIYTFTQKLYIPCFIWCIAFLHLVGRIVIFITALQATSFPVYVAEWDWLLTTNWALSVASDVVIATTLVVVLYRRRSYAHEKTVAVLDRLIVWTIETGMLTGIMSIIIISCFLTMKKNFVWMGFYVVGARFFANSLMANLNSRQPMNPVSPPTTTIGLRSNRSNRVEMEHFSYDAETSNEQGVKITKSVITESV